MSEPDLGFLVQLLALCLGLVVSVLYLALPILVWQMWRRDQRREEREEMEVTLAQMHRQQVLECLGVLRWHLDQLNRKLEGATVEPVSTPPPLPCRGEG